MSPRVEPEPIDPALIRLVRTLAVVTGKDPDAMVAAAFGRRGQRSRLPVQSRTSQAVLRFMLSDTGEARQVRCSVELGLSVAAVNQVWTRFRLRVGLLAAPPRRGKSRFRSGLP